MPSSASSTTQRSTLSLHDALPISARIVAGRGARQGGEQRRLGEREFGGLAAKVVPRAGGDAAGAVAEVDVVDVELEDLGLAVAVLDGLRDAHLEQLPVDLALGRRQRARKQVACELHRHRARAFLHLASTDVSQESAAYPTPIDA